MKYTEAFRKLGAEIKGERPIQRLAVNKNANIFAFWEYTDGTGGDLWRIEEDGLTIERKVYGPWTNSPGGNIFYKALLKAAREKNPIKVVKYKKDGGSDTPIKGDNAAEPMMCNDRPMLGRVQIFPPTAETPGDIELIKVFLKAEGERGYLSSLESTLLDEQKTHGIPAMTRFIKARKIEISGTEILWMHSIYTEELIRQLKEKHPDDKVHSEFAIGESRKRVDVLRKEKESGILHIYEIKTSTSTSACERESIGQLLEYFSLLKERGENVGSLTTVGLLANEQWIGRKALPPLSAPWLYLALDQG